MDSCGCLVIGVQTPKKATCWETTRQLQYVCSWSPGWIPPSESLTLSPTHFPHPPGLISCGARPTLAPSLLRWAGSATLWLPQWSSGMDGNLPGSYQTRSRSFLNLCSPVWISWHPALPPKDLRGAWRGIAAVSWPTSPLMQPQPRFHTSSEKSRERKREVPKSKTSRAVAWVCWKDRGMFIRKAVQASLVELITWCHFNAVLLLLIQWRTCFALPGGQTTAL